MQAGLARAQVKHRPQGTRTDLLPVQSRKLTSGSTNSAYLLRRIARERPDADRRIGRALDVRLYRSFLQLMQETSSKISFHMRYTITMEVI
jgi:hypothetical protein